MGDSTLIGFVALWVAAYVLGAIPFSYLIARLVGGIDLRQRGSGNVGGSNLASHLGRRWFPLVIAIDFGRGAGPILIGNYVLGWHDQPWLLAVTPLFTLVGNAWSPFLRFTGGRSVGVWVGGLIGISPTLVLAGLLAYLGAWFATRRSAESLLAILLALPLVGLAWPEAWLLTGAPPQLAVYAAAGAALIVLKRLTANGGPLPSDLPRASVLANRLLRDRDIADRGQWLARTTNQTGDP